MMHWVKKINYVDGYKISLTFNDKKTKIVDVEPYLDKGIFLDLRDPKYFKRVKVVDDTIVWPNDADFCPDVLYQIGKEEKESLKKIHHKQRRTKMPSTSIPQTTKISAKSKH